MAFGAMEHSMPLASAGALPAIARYYTRRVNTHGPTPWGVDWTCALTQQLRFVQLLKVCGRRRRFSLNDLGCGYGALLPFVRERYGPSKVDYAGADISSAMIRRARQLWADQALARFCRSSELPRVADFSVASGLFNVRLKHTDAVWVGFVKEVLGELQRASRIGFAVNFLLPALPGLIPLSGLYRTASDPWVDYCRETFRADVTVIRDYGLREFTLLVWPDPKSRAASGQARCFRTGP
jgi:SAM-dependent methyltransferase